MLPPKAPRGTSGSISDSRNMKIMVTVVVIVVVANGSQSAEGHGRIDDSTPQEAAKAPLDLLK